ncbi:MAG TPA: deoxyribodipyrimidine photo-lyase [Methanospirillum sp.]|nr:deoxyribodipyrimidine photo-lyase [Methanospirillum sp.]
MIQPERIHGELPEKTRFRGDHVLYWMQDAVRSGHNHALEYAIDVANSLNKPLICVFTLNDQFPEAIIRNYTFLCEGLIDAAKRLARRGISLQIWHGDPSQVIPKVAQDACCVVTDCGPLSVQKFWRGQVRDQLSCPFITVETGVIVPFSTASVKEEWSAGTFRPRITRQLPRFLIPLRERSLKISSLGAGKGDVRLTTPEEMLSGLVIDRSVLPSPIKGGETEALGALQVFISDYLDRYGETRHDPAARATSGMSPYLHFGHISPLLIALEVLKARSPGGPAFLEQLIVRRELAFNFVSYNPGYARYEAALPSWAMKSLDEHRSDPRPYEYDRADLIASATHDNSWNAMQTEMILSGSLHGYFRMYWGKKILEWSKTPEEAFSNALFLNNRYQLDGRDPNGFAGVAWCFGKHDRAWQERSVTGKIRYMNEGGLRRKFRMDAYINRIRQMAESWGHQPAG